MGRLGFRAAQRRQLQQYVHRTRTAAEYRRLVALLEIDQGTSVREVAHLLRVSEQSIYNWMARLGSRASIRRATGAALRTRVTDQPRRGRPTVWTDTHVACVQQLLASSPEAWGYFATGWTVPLLQEHVQQTLGLSIADDTLRRALHQWGYAWTRGRYRLTPDPGAEKKTRDLPSPPAVGGRTPTQCRVGGRRNRSAVVPGAARRLGATRTAA